MCINNVKHCCEQYYRGHSFLLTNISCLIWLTRSLRCFLDTVSAIFRTLKLQFNNISNGSYLQECDFDGHPRNKGVSVHGTQGLFDLLRDILSKNYNRISDRYWLFFILKKTARIKQNNEYDSTDILIIVFHKNYLIPKIFYLSFNSGTVSLTFYWTFLEYNLNKLNYFLH